MNVADNSKRDDNIIIARNYAERDSELDGKTIQILCAVDTTLGNWLRQQDYLRLYNVDVQRQNLYLPALYLRLLPSLAPIPLRRPCDAKAAPSLPTNSSPQSPSGTSPTNFATALTAPPTPSVTNSM